MIYLVSNVFMRCTDYVSGVSELERMCDDGKYC